MIDYESLFARMRGSPLEPWLETLPGQLAAQLDSSAHGDLARWYGILEHLPALQASTVELDTDCVAATGTADAVALHAMEQGLRALYPWRKGPFCLHGIHVDTEWRSDWKWDRLKHQIQPLDERLVLDVGCGNGYHLWRMIGAGARLAIGVDPTLLYTVQYAAVRSYLGDRGAYVLPMRGEDVPALECFDTVFSMGVLYHRRSPLDHLAELRACLRPGGELVLETLVVEGGEDTVLMPSGRYAQMRNVWFIPSSLALVRWMERSGFKAVRVVDVTPTQVQEQRSTDWMRFKSLADFLDPSDLRLTVEGLPAPRRAILLATAP